MQCTLMRIIIPFMCSGHRDTDVDGCLPVAAGPSPRRWFTGRHSLPLHQEVSQDPEEDDQSLSSQ